MRHHERPSGRFSSSRVAAANERDWHLWCVDAISPLPRNGSWRGVGVGIRPANAPEASVTDAIVADFDHQVARYHRVRKNLFDLRRCGADVDRGGLRSSSVSGTAEAKISC
jgi:hypothetical protein